jgi:hypothetical protein
MVTKIKHLRHVETRPLLLNQQAFPWIRASNKQFPRIPLHYISDHSAKNEFITRVVSGSNTSTVTLRVVGGDDKGSLKSETVASPKGLGPEKECAGRDQQQIQTIDPPSRQR